MGTFSPAQIVLPMKCGDTIDVLFSPAWGIYDTSFGIIGVDVTAIYEMMEMAEAEHYANLDREIHALGETIRIENIFVHSETWWSTGDHRVSVLPEDVNQTLKDAEEDFDYEEWINSKQYQKSLEEFNFHKLMSCEKEHPSSLWSGECTGDKGLLTTSQDKSCVLYETLFKDRFKVDAIIRTEFPKGNRGYAKASSSFGDIYIPNRFKGYIGQPGAPQQMTVALQDVGNSSRKGNGFRFTCIYNH